VSLFITGTDTGVGKTHIAARLLRLMRASGTLGARDETDLLWRSKLPVLVITQNRLGCSSSCGPYSSQRGRIRAPCAGVVLNRNSTEIKSDIAALTNADILNQILNVPLLAELGESLTELPVDWRLMLDFD